MLRLFPDALDAHAAVTVEGADPYLVAPIADLVAGRFILDERQGAKQPDWTYDETDSGASPADRIDTRAADR